MLKIHTLLRMTIEKKVEKILARNRRVEEDKAWENSFTRRFSLMLLIYCTALFLLMLIDVQRSWLAAFVPAAGFYFSTLTLPFIRKRWNRK